MTVSSQMITQQIGAHKMACAAAGHRSGFPLAPAEMRPSKSTNVVNGSNSKTTLAPRARRTTVQGALVRFGELTLISNPARYMSSHPRPCLPQSSEPHSTTLSSVLSQAAHKKPKTASPLRYYPSNRGHGFLNGHIQRGRDQLRGQQLGCSP